MRVMSPRRLFLGIALAFAALAVLGVYGSHAWPHAFHGAHAAHGALLPALFYVAFTFAAFRLPDAPPCDACGGRLDVVDGFCAACGATTAHGVRGRKSQAGAPPPGAR